MSGLAQKYGTWSATVGGRLGGQRSSLRLALARLKYGEADCSHRGGYFCVAGCLRRGPECRAIPCRRPSRCSFGAGSGRLNTSYFLRAVTLAAGDTASRPYWRRSAGEPFSAFGSTVGNDAGMNLLHEFGPGIQHAVKSHGPKFVARIIGDRITHK